MKQNILRKGYSLFCIAVMLCGIISFNANAQTTVLSDYVMFSGNGGAGTTAPGSAGYGVFFGSSSTITGGAIGSDELVQTTGGANLTTAIYSGGKIILANGNSVSGPISAANTASASGTILSVGSNAVLSGVINVNGNIEVQSGTVSGPVTHPVGTTYSGPVPTAGEIIGIPTFPVLPTYPAATVFPAAGSTNITNTTSISPGNYGNVTFANNKTLTLNGTGVYVFNSITMSGNNNFIYNFQNQSVGVFKIYVHGNAFLGKFNASLTNGGNSTRIYWEVQGAGSSGSDAVTIANGSSGGNGSVKFIGSINAYNAGILLGSGTGSSQFTGTLHSRVRVMVQTGVTLIYSAFDECIPFTADAGADVTGCGSINTQIGSAPDAGFTYSWSPSTGLSDAAIANPTVTSSTAGTTVYTVVMTQASTTCTSSDQVSVTVNPLPNVNAGADGAHDCLIASVFLSGSSTTPGALYNWTTGINGNIIADGNTPSPEVKVYGTFFVTTEDFTLTVTDPSTGCTASDIAEVSFDPCILPGIDPPANGKTDTILNSELSSLYQHYINNGNDCTNPNLDLFIMNDACQVLVEIVFIEGMDAGLLALLAQSPYNITSTLPIDSGTRVITVWIDLADLSSLNSLYTYINHVRNVLRGIPTVGVAFDSCDIAQKSDIARLGFDVDGTGIKIGVLSNSYNTILGNPALTDVLNGDLPGTGNPDGHTTPVQVLQEYPYGTQTDEGRGMLQIAHDVAPNAELAFASGFLSALN
ncbi:MAG TPA: hypothetical protein VI757_08370, partial [Bacteroidia bacterium]|nr:hypothetical protein [Bacteroidia bacterium]